MAIIFGVCVPVTADKLMLGRVPVVLLRIALFFGEVSLRFVVKLEEEIVCVFGEFIVVVKVDVVGIVGVIDDVLLEEVVVDVLSAKIFVEVVDGVVKSTVAVVPMVEGLSVVLVWM